MSNRVTSAIASRKARENLIRLLFPDDILVAAGARKSPAASSMPRAHREDRDNNCRRRRRMCDVPSSATDAAGHQKRHSYSQLRSAYIRKVHTMHPDKVAHRSGERQRTTGGNETTSKKETNNNNMTKDAHLQFIELKNAWEEYYASVRIVKRRGGYEEAGGSSRNHDAEDDLWEEEDSFTTFGVGCSFADSPEERDLRNRIMDQAGRGWFSSGSLFSGARTENQDGDSDCISKRGGTSVLQDAVDEKSGLLPQMKLSDDDMFVCSDQSEKEASTKRKYLVQDVERFRRKG